jgi:transposase
MQRQAGWLRSNPRTPLKAPRFKSASNNPSCNNPKREMPNTWRQLRRRATGERNDAQAAKASCSREQRTAIKAFDMSAAYTKVTKEAIPPVVDKIGHDRFHVTQVATDSVDMVRRAEHEPLKSEGDVGLTKSRYLWFTKQTGLREDQRRFLHENFPQRLQTGKAWAGNETFRDLRPHADSSSTTTYFKDGYTRAIRTAVEPMKRVARTIKERLPNIVSDCTHRFTNATAKGFDSTIISIKRRDSGYRDVEHFKTAIFTYRGGPNLYPPYAGWTMKSFLPYMLSEPASIHLNFKQFEPTLLILHFSVSK